MKRVTGYKGKVFFNKKYPDGVLKRKLSDKILKNYGWKAKIKLDSTKGLVEYYNHFIKLYDKSLLR